MKNDIYTEVKLIIYAKCFNNNTNILNLLIKIFYNINIQKKGMFIHDLLNNKGQFMDYEALKSEI